MGGNDFFHFIHGMQAQILILKEGKIGRANLDKRRHAAAFSKGVLSERLKKAGHARMTPTDLLNQ
jgi:hypothetical protein